MASPDTQRAQRALAILRQALSDVPARVEPLDGATESRVPVLIEGHSERNLLTLLWAGQGWPADVEIALEDVPEPWPRDLVAVAPQFSPGALRLLQERNANWVDGTGDAQIVGPGEIFVIRRNGTLPSVRANGISGAHADQLSQAPEVSWSASVLDVAEALLALPKARISTTKLSKLTGRAPSQVSKTLAEFDRIGWTEKIGSRGPGAYRRLVDPDALLRSWAVAASREPRSVLQGHALMSDPIEFLQTRLAPALDTSSTAWASTTWAALELTAPFATQVPVLHIYVDADSMASGFASVMHATGLRPVETGGRVQFWSGREPMFRIASAANADASLAVPVVSPPRLYADLVSLGGRGIDAAEHVRESLLDF